MNTALVGRGGIVIGAFLGGTGKYFALRHDAWREVRASGLLVLGTVRALCAASAADEVVAVTRLGVGCVAASSWRD